MATAEVASFEMNFFRITGTSEDETCVSGRVTMVLLTRPGITLCETKKREVWVQAFAWWKISTLNYLFHVMRGLNFFSSPAFLM